MKKKKNTKKINSRKKRPINKLVNRRNKKINIIIEKRYKILIVFIIILMFLLVIKLFFMQIINNDKYQIKLKELTLKIIDGPSTPRGRIYDRNGKIIVDNKPLKTIYYKSK